MKLWIITHNTIKTCEYKRTRPSSSGLRPKLKCRLGSFFKSHAREGHLYNQHTRTDRPQLFWIMWTRETSLSIRNPTPIFQPSSQ